MQRFSTAASNSRQCFQVSLWNIVSGTALIKSPNTLPSALINFANTYLVTDPNGRPSGKGIPDKLKKLNALKMNFVHCPTLELTVQPNQEYKLISESQINIIQFLFRPHPSFFLQLLRNGRLTASFCVPVLMRPLRYCASARMVWYALS